MIHMTQKRWKFILRFIALFSVCISAHILGFKIFLGVLLFCYADNLMDWTKNWK